MAKRSKKKIGLPPGAVIFTGKRKVDQINIHYLQYNEQELEEQVLDNRSITNFHQPNLQYVQWYDIRGLHDIDLIQQIGGIFKVHPLALEDIANTFERPKMDEYTEGIFITIKALSFDKTEQTTRFEQVAFYLGQNFVLSFQEKADDLLVNIRQRLHQSAGRIRKRGADYLLYTLIDSIVDQYTVVIDEIEDVIQKLEVEIIQKANDHSRSRIYELKRELQAVRKAVFPLRELISSLISSENTLISEPTEFYLRDLRDHVFQTIELIETYRDNLTGLQDLYLSELSHRTNGVVQLLTIVSTIFIPLTFLAGIYGMNFQHMPELEWQYGYFFLLGLMLLIVLMMIWYFRRKGWV